MDTCREILDRCCSLNAGLVAQLGVSDSCRSIKLIAPPCGNNLNCAEDHIVILLVPVLQFPSAPVGGSPPPAPGSSTLVAHAQKEAAHRSHVLPAWL